MKCNETREINILQNELLRALQAKEKQNDCEVRKLIGKMVISLFAYFGAKTTKPANIITYTILDLHGWNY